MRFLLAYLALGLAATVALAGPYPINLSLTPDIALHGRTERIEGLTLSVWGENPQTALSLGLANGSTGASAGLSWAWLLNYAEDYKGVHWALINYTSHDFLGWQGGLVNYTANSLKGLQTGAVNGAGRLTGLQFGFVNYAEDTDAGVQIGLVNFIRANQGWFTELPDELAPAMIFVNWRF